MTSSASFDRRKVMRFRAEYPVTIEFTGSSGNRMKAAGKTLDISVTGMSITSSVAVPAHTALMVTLLDGSSTVFSLRGRVKQSHVAQNRFNIELVGVTADTEDKIYRLIESSKTLRDRRTGSSRRSELPSARQRQPRFHNPHWKATVGVAGQISIDVEVLNLSETGLCVKGPVPINLSQTVNVTVAQCSFKARVAWVKSGENPAVGLEITAQSGAHPISQLLTEMSESTDRVDRRSPDLDRRSLTDLAYKARQGEFTLEKTVYLTDTNAFGNTYFAQYFDWQGMAREAFIRACVPQYDQLFTSGIKLITVEAYMRYLSETRVFDDILISLRLGKLTHATAEMLFWFRLKRNRKLCGEGRQVIAFGGPSGKLIRMPNVIKANIQSFIANARN